MFKEMSVPARKYGWFYMILYDLYVLYDFVWVIWCCIWFCMGLSDVERICLICTGKIGMYVRTYRSSPKKCNGCNHLDFNFTRKVMTALWFLGPNGWAVFQTQKVTAVGPWKIASQTNQGHLVMTNSSLLKIPHLVRWFTYSKWWISIVML